ncbi:MAG TPA: pyridoxamine 5'-phosphate oxidase family protein [Rhodanobacteraceae bacterium]
MGRAFVDFAFTPEVKAVQARYGTRAANQRLETAGDRNDTLTEAEVDFITSRDGFYQATVSGSGWPYVQFRGGPAGFLRVIDDKTIGYADFRGNVQYLTIGNLEGQGRIALILMDYANQRRLKIWGRARVIHAADEPERVNALAMPGYRARVERAVVITVEAFDWNCPQHITRRFTEAEVQASIAPLLEELTELRRRVERLDPNAQRDDSSPD